MSEKKLFCESVTSKNLNPGYLSAYNRVLVTDDKRETYTKLVDLSEMDTICQRAVYKFGKVSQLGMAVEECAELIKAINKYNRNPSGETRDELLYEIADVEIMCLQIKKMFPITESDAFKQEKLTRLKALLDNK